MTVQVVKNLNEPLVWPFLGTPTT